MKVSAISVSQHYNRQKSAVKRNHKFQVQNSNVQFKGTLGKVAGALIGGSVAGVVTIASLATGGLAAAAIVAAAEIGGVVVGGAIGSKVTGDDD